MECNPQKRQNESSEAFTVSRREAQTENTKNSVLLWILDALRIGEMSPIEARKALESLFVDDEEFQKLEVDSGGFNLFQVANIGGRELVHSDCLAYFFDPAANHGFGSIVLDRFLWTIAENSTFDRLDFHLASTSEVKILREWKSIDILIQ